MTRAHFLDREVLSPIDVHDISPYPATTSRLIRFFPKTRHNVCLIHSLKMVLSRPRWLWPFSACCSRPIIPLLP